MGVRLVTPNGRPAPVVTPVPTIRVAQPSNSRRSRRHPELMQKTVVAFVPSYSTPTESFISSIAVTSTSQIRIHVRMPTRKRHDQAARVLELYKKMAGRPITTEVVVDEDDSAQNEIYKRLGVDRITVGRHQSKIEAVNAGSFKDWDVLILASDDMVPVANGYAARIADDMNMFFPMFDGALHYSDGYQNANLCTLPVLGRRLYEAFDSKVYDPAYRSLFCDQEQTYLLRNMRRLQFINQMIIEHRHHCVRKSSYDESYKRNDSLWGRDQATYMQRKANTLPHAQFAFNSPPLWLSVLICALPSRIDKLRSLLDHLWGQILAVHGDGWSARRKVEVLIDGGQGTVGEKRQRLLASAQGHFVCYIDDDDRIAEDYIRRIVSAIERDPSVDCTSLMGIMITDGQNPKRFDHSNRYSSWATVGDIYVRNPNHLNSIRREHALKTGFQALNKGEDLDYSSRIKPLLKKEADLGPAPIYYYDFLRRK